MQPPTSQQTAPRRALGFFAGLRYPWRGARFVYVQHRGLARLWLPPVLITFALLCAGAWFALDVRDDLTNWLWSEPVGEGWLAGLQRFAHAVLEWTIAALLLASVVVAVALVSSVIAAPFNDALSEAVESIARARPAPSFSAARLLRDLVRTVGLEALKFGLYAAVMLPLFLVGLLVPAVGPAIQGVAGFLFTAFFFAIDYVDWAASRRDVPVAARIRWGLSHARPLLGLGTGIAALLFVPLVNLLFMPAAVAGATLLYLDLTEPEAGVPRPPTPHSSGT